MALGVGSDTGHRLGMGGASGRAVVWRRIPRRANWFARRRGSGHGCCSIGWTICSTWARGSAGGAQDALVTFASSRARARCGFSSAPTTDAGIGACWGRRRGWDGAWATFASREMQSVLALPPEEQYLVATGRTYFRDLSFDQLRRMQFDLETTGLDPRAIGSSWWRCATLRTHGNTRGARQGDAAEAELIRRLVAKREGGRSGRDRESQPARIRPAVSRSPRARPRRAAGARADRAAGLRQRAARRGTYRHDAHAAYVSSHPAAS